MSKIALIFFVQAERLSHSYAGPAISVKYKLYCIKDEFVSCASFIYWASMKHQLDIQIITPPNRVIMRHTGNIGFLFVYSLFEAGSL